MKIGIVGPIWLNVPPERYGGTEDVVYNLANGLVAHGHDVTLFGPGTASVKSKLFPTVQQPLREMGVDWENITYPLYHITAAFDRAAEFDVLHVHLNKSSDYMALPLALSSQTPVLFTLHFRLPLEHEQPDRYRLLEKYRELPYTSISQSQQKLMKLHYVGTIYNALDLERFPFSDRKGTYLVWIGRVTPVKGTKEAILAAKKAGMKLYVMGTLDLSIPEVVTYYEEEIKPLLDKEQIIWLGEVSHNEKASVLAGAKAMLNPIHWEEPFGLVMAEAQATGTPVISFRRGSAPELILDGETGFLVNSLEEMVDKIAVVDTLSRKACREHVEKKFSIDSLVAGYTNAYEDVVKHWRQYVSAQKAILRD